MAEKATELKCQECGAGFAIPDPEENRESLARHMRWSHGRKVSEGKEPLGSPIAIRLGDELRGEIEEIADSEGRTVGDVCRELIEDAMGDNPNRARRTLIRSLAIAQRQVEQAARSAVFKREDAQRLLKSLVGGIKSAEGKVEAPAEKSGRRFVLFRSRDEDEE